MQVLAVATFFAAIAAAAALSAQRSEVRFIEDLRFNTRSPLGWILLLCIFAIPIAAISLIIRLLDVRVITNYRKILLFVVRE